MAHTEFSHTCIDRVFMCFATSRKDDAFPALLLQKLVKPGKLLVEDMLHGFLAAIAVRFVR